MTKPTKNNFFSLRKKCKSTSHVICVDINAHFELFQQTGGRVFSRWPLKEGSFSYSLWPAQSRVSSSVITCIISSYKWQNACVLFTCTWMCVFSYLFITTCSAESFHVMPGSKSDIRDTAKKLVCYFCLYAKQPTFRFIHMLKSNTVTSLTGVSFPVIIICHHHIVKLWIVKRFFSF